LQGKRTIAVPYELWEGALDHEIIGRVLDNVDRVIVGKRPVVELLLAAMMCEGHVLIEDVPGIGKTTLAKAVARSSAAHLAACNSRPTCCPAT